MSDTTKRILVIDDEPDVITYLTTLLEDDGYAVVSACDGLDGLEKARKTLPALITLDITMPRRSGIEVLTVLRRDAQLKHIPVVVITGVADFTKQTAYREISPPESILAKPINQTEVLAVVRRLLKG